MENPPWVKILLDLENEVKNNRHTAPPEIKEIPKIVLSPKEEGLLWFEMLRCLKELEKDREIISFTKYFESICRKFSITKAKAWNCLFFLAEFGFIKIIRCHGIKINYKLIPKI